MILEVTQGLTDGLDRSTIIVLYGTITGLLKKATRALDSLSLINEEVVTVQVKSNSPSGLKKLKSKKTVIKGFVLQKLVS